MRALRHAITTALLAILGWLAFAPGADARRQRCRPQHSHTIVASRTVRVFDFPTQGPIGYFACAFRRGRSYRLSEPRLEADSNGFIGDALSEPLMDALAGTKVAYTFTDGPSGLGPIGVLRVLDVAAGRLLHTVFTPRPDAGSGKQTIVEFGSVILQPDGTVAWTGSFDDSSLPASSYPLTEVGVADSSGWRTLDRSTPLDPAGRIFPYSLRLAGGLLSWKRNDVTRTAPLH